MGRWAIVSLQFHQLSLSRQYLGLSIRYYTYLGYNILYSKFWISKIAKIKCDKKEKEREDGEMSDSFSPIPPIVPLVTTQTRLLLAQLVNPSRCRYNTKTMQIQYKYNTNTTQIQYKDNVNTTMFTLNTLLCYSKLILWLKFYCIIGDKCVQYVICIFISKGDILWIGLH